MKSVAKTVSLILAVVVFLILFSSLLVALLFDPNQYRTEICQLVQEKTGRNLKINGAIEFNVFPWLGLKANNVVMAGGDKASSQPFITIDRIKLRVHFLSLIRKHLEIGRISLAGLRINLPLDHWAGGWRDLLPQRLNDGRPLLAQRFSNPRVAQIMALTIGGVNLRRSAVTWTDRDTGKRFLLENLNLTSGPIELSKDFKVESSFDFVDEATGSRGHVQVSASLAVDLERGRVRFQPLQIDLRLENPDRFPKPFDFAVRAQSFSYQDVGRINWQGLRITQAQTGLESNGTLAFQDSNYCLNGHLSLESADFTPLLQGLGWASLTGPRGNVLHSGRLQCGFAGDRSALRLVECKGQLDQSSFTGSLSFADKPSPKISFDMTLDRIDLDRYLSQQPDKSKENPQPKKPDKKVQAAAHPHPMPAANARPEVKRSLPSTLARRLFHALPFPFATISPAHAAVSPQPPPPTPASDPPPVIEGKINIDQLAWARLRLNRVSFLLSSANRQIVIKPLTARLYGGKLDAAVHIVPATAGKKTVARFSASQLQLATLIEDLAGKTHASGQMSLRGDLATWGHSRTEHLQTMSGKVKIKIRDFRGPGFDLRQAIINATPVLGRKLPLSPARKPAARLDSLRATMLFKDGEMHLESLVGRSRSVRLQGSGSADMIRKTLDLLIIVHLSPRYGIREQGSYAFLSGVPIPFHIKGTFSRPIVSLDLREVLQRAMSARRKKHRGFGDGSKP